MVRENLEFAALFHDIGKFFQLTEYGKSSELSEEYQDFSFPVSSFEHGKFSAEFLKKHLDSGGANLALYHHIPDKAGHDEILLSKIIQIADSHASGENLEEIDIGDIKRSQLFSIFSQVWINPKKNKEKPSEFFIPLEKLDLDNFDDLIPKDSQIKEESLEKTFTNLWDEFIGEIDSLNNKKDFTTLFALLRKYASILPSKIYGEKTDISLYDHSKITAALALSRYIYNESSNDLNDDDNQRVYLAINGDISGIQKFIFRISSPQEAQSGMSRRLRGRSLYLSLLNDSIVSRIIRRLGLNEANVLFSGGGRFTIIAPNTEETKDILDDIKKKINGYFIDNFNAELYLAIAYEECSGNDLKEFGKITHKLSNKVNEDKKHKFYENINDLFCIDEDLKNKTTCSVCGNLYTPKSNKDYFCKSCKTHSRLGREVANAVYMIKIFFNEDFKYDQSKFQELVFYNDSLKLGYMFISKKKDSSAYFEKINNHFEKFNSFCEKFEIIKLNGTAFLELEKKFDNEKISFNYSFIGNTVPSYYKQTLYFEHLAQISTGSNKFGILKMDVDDLGLIFSTGFNHINAEGQSNISRVSTLSSQMDMFFSGFINKIANKYIVYQEEIKEFISEDLLKENFIKTKLNFQDDDEGLDSDKDSLYVYKLIDDGREIEESAICEKLKNYEIPTIYINYSGGDDLLVFGPYDDIIKFAHDLRESFKLWTCNNNSINLSGGINIISAKFPIGKAVDMAESYLEASKYSGKNKITLFNETVDWNKLSSAGFDDLLKFAIYLESKYNEGNNGVSKSFIYSLLHMWQYTYDKKTALASDEDEWKSIIADRQNTKRYVPIFKYKLRLIKNEKIRNEIDEKVLEFMPWIRIPVSWVSLRTR